MLSGYFNALLRRYASFLYNYPSVFLILTPLFLCLCAIFSFAPSVGVKLPNFSKPTEGFEPRGTEIMKRVVTQQNTLFSAIQAGKLTCPDGSLNKNYTSPPRIFECSKSEYRDFSIVSVYESGGNLFNVNDLKSICHLEKDMVGFATSYCKSLSLGSYIALLRNQTSCLEIEENDVTFAQELLENCSSAYFSRKLDSQSSTLQCRENKEFVKNVFDLLVDTDYLRTSKSLTTTLALSPKYYDVNVARDIYKKHLEGGKKPQLNGVKLVAFHFGNFKFDQFNYKLIMDAVFPAIGLAMVALILLLYTQSLVVMAMTVFSVITSIVAAYFIYHQIFRLTFFPFLNILAFVFLVGIAADDAFVFNDIWAQAKAALPNGTIVDWIEYTLRHAALAMFVTSFTTSAAFYANVVSDITAIRLFGIFSGTSILIMYFLMITWFPAGVVAMEKRRQLRSVGVDTSKGDENASFELDCDDKSTHSNPEPIASHGQQSTCSRFIDFYIKLRCKCSCFMGKIFNRWIPACLRVYPAWLIGFLALGIGMICAVTVNPGLQRPKSSDFQVFASSHILEQYDLKYKSKFRLKLTEGNIFRIYMFFGIKDQDNGNYLEPKNFGSLEYDTTIDIFDLQVQKWLFEDLCPKIRNQTFFEQDFSWSCYTEALRQACPVNWPLPMDQEQLTKCLMSHTYSNCGPYSNNIFLHKEKIKALGLWFPTNIHFTNDYNTVNRVWKHVKEFSRTVLDNAPEGIRNGWATSRLRFYALQENLASSTITSLAVSLSIAFSVMLITTLNWLVSFYAILTIVFVLSSTIGSLVINGWELNILESIVISVAVGLSVDFTLHYGVAYKVSNFNERIERVKCTLEHIGPAVTLAAFTTFVAGVFMMPSEVLAYFQLGQFLTLVMAMSWLFATFFFMSLCYFAGPVGYFGQMTSTKCLSCEVS